MAHNSNPLLKLGTFGTHILHNPAGTYSFVGEVPKVCKGVYQTYQKALNAFVQFYHDQDKGWQDANFKNLREDIQPLI